jgi:hypothetical protein
MKLTVGRRHRQIHYIWHLMIVQPVMDLVDHPLLSSRHARLNVLTGLREVISASTILLYCAFPTRLATVSLGGHWSWMLRNRSNDTVPTEPFRWAKFHVWGDNNDSCIVLRLAREMLGGGGMGIAEAVGDVLGNY